MIKRVLTLLLIVFACCAKAAAQSKVTRYCEIDVRGGKVKLFTGAAKTFLPRDTTVLQRLKLVTTCKDDVDVLNYMDSIGWTLVNVHAANLQTATEIFYYKKEFDSTDFINK